MSKCPNCGTDFEGKFCPECGRSVNGERLCPNCKNMVPSNAKFCTECGFSFHLQEKEMSAQKAKNTLSSPPIPEKTKKVHLLLSALPSAIFVFFSVLYLLFFLAPVAVTPGDLLGEKIKSESYGNVYQLKNYADASFSTTLIALLVFASIAVALAVVVALVCLSASGRAKRVSVFGKVMYLRSALTLFGYGIIFALVVVSCILIAQIPKEDGGIGLIKTGAAPILILVFSLGSLVTATICAFAKHMLETAYPTLTDKVRAPEEKNFVAQTKAHKKLLMAGAFILVVIIGLSVGIPLAILNRHNGTYYLYQNGEYNYEKYFILQGKSYTDESGYSCDVEFDGDRVKMYGELFGIRDVMAEGTIEDDILKLKISGAEAVYVKKGHVHKLHEEVAQEATCEKTGTIISSCACGYRTTEMNAIPALGHEFDKNHLCKRCGIGNGVLLKFSLNKEETKYTVTGLGDCKDNVIIIPRIYNGLPVVSIGEGVFADCTGLTSIDIPDSVTSIGKNAFDGCSNLTSIDIPDNVTSIGDSAFESCNKLTSVTIGSSVTSIGDYAFSGCSGLTSIVIPNSVTLIGNRAFYNCSMTSIVIPDNVTSIGNYAFDGCSELEKIIVDEGNTTYSSQDGILYNKAKTKFVHIPRAIKGAVVIPNGVTSIGDYACHGCSGLTSIVIPDSVTSIGHSAFSYCSGLQEVHITDLAAWCGIDFSDYPFGHEHHLFMNGEEITKLEIPDGVTSIGENAFYGCSGLTSVIIPDSVTSIGDYAFCDCRKLASVTIGKNVTSIGRAILYGCNRLQEVRFENPNGWKVSKNKNMSNAESVSGLDDPATGAAYLKGTFYDYYWKREA